MRPFITASSAIALALCTTLATPALATVTPNADDSLASQEVTQSIRLGSYVHINFDKAWSNKAFDLLVKSLDPQHLYLTAADVGKYQWLRNNFAQVVSSGQLTSPYNFYNLFQSRVQERLEWLITQLQKPEPFNFNTDERLPIKNAVPSWASSFDSLNDIWQKRLLNAALIQKITEPKLTDKEIKTRLIQRFKEQLNLLKQTNTDDVLSLIMGAETNAVDPHTAYMSPEDSESFDIQMRLSLDGIGAVLQAQDEYVKVASLVPGGPAARSGKIHVGDKIIAVGQGDSGPLKSIAGMRIDDVVKFVRGKKGTDVRLQIIPAHSVDPSQTRTITITREQVKLEDQAAKGRVVDIDHNGQKERVGVITIPAFYLDFAGYESGAANYRSSTRDVAEQIEKLKKQNIQGLILDIRNNGGGALQEAISMIGLFVDQGPAVQVRDARGHVSIYGNDHPSMVWSGPLAVMVNRLSASASEIFAGAIQDYGRGLILGSRSFGKGSVQTVSDLTHGELRLTRAKFYRISGGSTQDHGVTPDISYPSFYNDKEIGESSLPNAMPWDTIPAAQHRMYGDPKAYLPELQKLHNQRINREPNFLYLTQEVELINRLDKQDTSVSLNIDQRRKEMRQQNDAQLQLENARRKALHLKPLKEGTNDFDALDSIGSDDANSPINQAEVDESAQILADYAQLTAAQNQVSQNEANSSGSDTH
ncbi:Tail-specific protease [Halomonadaceae bacterium LMG 33818]|uniref:carboxy terminal-processing peptidase n=1 Tax=Cernens ardua TaxID=3402176 RepID=UPI003EDBB81D